MLKSGQYQENQKVDQRNILLVSYSMQDVNNKCADIVDSNLRTIMQFTHRHAHIVSIAK